MTTPSFGYRDTPASSEDALALLATPLADWFRRRYGQPTVVQRLTWPAVAQGEHVLVSAPTGTGKTLAALLPVLGDLLAPWEPGGWSTSPLRAVYLAPLKALVNDAARGLERLLAELAEGLAEGGRLPRLAVRTGDTTPAERRQLSDDPPDLLLTTPESLAVLLSLGSTSGLLANVRWVVVDEVHALAGNKRGADLAVCLERLEALTEGKTRLRRLGLSATATPLDTAARW